MSRPYLNPTAAAVDDMDCRWRGLPWMWIVVNDEDCYSASYSGDVDRRRVMKAFARAGRRSPSRARERADGVRGVAMRSRRTARIYPRLGGIFPKLPKMGRRDGKLLESVFCQFAKN